MGKQNNRMCRDCRYYNVLYAKCICRFERKDVGICAIKYEIVKKGEQCEMHKYKLKQIKFVTQKHLDIVYYDIKDLEKFYSIVYDERCCSCNKVYK